MEKIHENVYVCDFVNFKQAQKHAHCHVNFPFNAYFLPHYIIIVKGLLVGNATWSTTLSLTGYARVIFAIISFWYMPTNPAVAGICYVLSGGLDAFDGLAARKFNQGSPAVAWCY